jgi:hypothetical protein
MARTHIRDTLSPPQYLGRLEYTTIHAKDASVFSPNAGKLNFPVRCSRYSLALLGRDFICSDHTRQLAGFPKTLPSNFSEDSLCPWNMWHQHPCIPSF